jgi:flagellar biosynthesis protein FlhF
MRQIREELGPDAVILHTTQVRPSGLRRLGGATEVEVVAALDRVPPRTEGAAAALPATHARRGRTPARRPGAPPARAFRKSPQTVEEQLADLRDLVVRLGGVRLLTPELVSLWERLVGAGVEESVAHATLRSLPRGDEDGRPLDGDALLAALEERLAAMLPIARPPVTARPPVVALVGPPGAGKTVTLAKLAARARIAGVQVGIASAADGLLGSPSPLESFAPILGATYDYAPTAPDLAPLATGEGRTGTLLIDTPGVSPGDGDGLASLETLLRAAAPTQVHLVLPATATTADALAAVRAFAPLGVSDLVWTRLDEAQTLGTLLSVALEVGRPLSWFGTGPDVPGDLEQASGEALVRRVLAVEAVA